MDIEFSWFPDLKEQEILLVFVDSELGCLVDLHGAIALEENMTEGLFYRVFSDRDSALKWATENKPNTTKVLCLLYDFRKNEEYVTLPVTESHDQFNLISSLSKLSDGHFALLQNDPFSGSLVDSEGEWIKSDEERYLMFESECAARNYASSKLKENPLFEWGLYNSDGVQVDVLHDKESLMKVTQGQSKRTSRIRAVIISDKPFKKAFLIGGLYYIIILVTLIITKANNFSYRSGSIFAQLLISSGMVGLIAHFSKKKWGWFQIGLWIVLLIALLTVLQATNI